VDKTLLKTLTGVPEFDIAQRFKSLETSASSGKLHPCFSLILVESDFREAIKETIPLQMSEWTNILPKRLPETKHLFPVSRTELWAHSLMLHQLQNGYWPSPCSPSELQASSKNVRDLMTENLNSALLHEQLRSQPFHLIQTILDFLALNLGVEVSFQAHDGRDRLGCLKNVFCKQGIMELWIEVRDDPSVIIREHIEGVPFLWATSSRVRIHMTEGMRFLRPLWFRGNTLEPAVQLKGPQSFRESMSFQKN